MKKRTVVTLLIIFLVTLISVILVIYCREVYKTIAMACGGVYIGHKCNKLIDWICADNNEESEVDTE